MKATLGVITGIEYASNRDGTDIKVLAQAILEDSEDVQTVELIQRGGEQLAPVEGSQVVALEIEDSYKIGIAIDDGSTPDITLFPGDKKFYSLLLTPGETEDDADTVSLQAIVKLLKTGEIKLQAADGLKIPKPLGLIRLLPTGAIEINSTDINGAIKGTVKILNTGDIEMEASAGGATQNLKNDGQAEINGTGDHAVRFAELETAFNQLKSDFDAHMHTGNLAAPTSPPLAPSTADISPAKIDTIEVPS